MAGAEIGLGGRKGSLSERTASRFVRPFGQMKGEIGDFHRSPCLGGKRDDGNCPAFALLYSQGVLSIDVVVYNYTGEKLGISY